MINKRDKMYLNASRFTNLVPPKAAFQLFRQQVHTPSMEARQGFPSQGKSIGVSPTTWIWLSPLLLRQISFSQWGAHT